MKDSDLLAPLLAAKAELRRFLRSRVADEATADELLQRSFLKAVEKAESLREEESVLEWFRQIVRNTLVDHYRAAAVERKKAERFGREQETEVGAGTETGAAICACLTRLLPTLKPSYAELVRKIDLEENAPEAVAKELGITPNNLGVRLHRARQALKASLERCCGACSKHGCLDCTCEHGTGAAL